MWARHPLKRKLRGPVDAEVWGLRLRLMPRGNLSESRWLFLPRHFDRAERAYWRRTLRPGDTFLDIGANAGAYSFWAAMAVGRGGVVLAIEPDPALRERIAFNASLNDLPQIRLVDCALGDAPGEATLVLGRTNRGQNVLAGAADPRAAGDAETDADHSDRNVQADAGCVTVVVRTLLDVVEEHSLDRIDGLKIDIEGHEHRVMRHFFEHAPASLHPARLQFERCTRQQADSMRTLMDEHGYRCVCTGRMNAIYQRA